jgi:hypothetical protein
MSKYFSDEPVWFESKPETRALGGKTLVVVENWQRKLTVEDHPSESAKIAVAATAYPLVDVPNDPMKEGVEKNGYLTKIALDSLRPGSDFAYGDDHVVLE